MGEDVGSDEDIKSRKEGLNKQKEGGKRKKLI